HTFYTLSLHDALPISDEKQPFAFQIFRAPVRVFEKRVAAVNDDVAGFEMGDEQVNEFVHRFAGFDHQHDPAGFLQQGHQFLDGRSEEHTSELQSRFDL